MCKKSIDMTNTTHDGVKFYKISNVKLWFMYFGEIINDYVHIRKTVKNSEFTSLKSHTG